MPSDNKPLSDPMHPELCRHMAWRGRDEVIMPDTTYTANANFKRVTLPVEFAYNMLVVSHSHSHTR